MALDQIKVPDMPETLESNTRRAARAIKSTVRDALETMREVADIINRYRAGESAVIARLSESQTEQAAQWRKAVETAEQRDKKADADYAEAIKPFAEKRDAEKRATADTVKQYFDAAVAAEELPADQTPPSQEEHAEAVQDWTASVKQIRDAQRNAKNQLSLEFDVEIPNIGGTRDGGQSGQWRPRFSEVTVNGKSLGESPILTDVIAEIPGMSRDMFIGQILTHLSGHSRADWEAMNTGDVLPLSFTHNDKPYSIRLTKAAPITRKRADGAEETVSDDDTETVAAPTTD
jgi:hypothetical protein